MTQENGNDMQIPPSESTPAPAPGPVARAQWNDAGPPNRSLEPLDIQPLATLDPR